MNQIIIFAKAVPWGLLCRFGVRVFKFLVMTFIALLAFSFKVFAALATAEGKNPEGDDDDDDDTFYVGWSCPAAVKPRFGTAQPHNGPK